MTRRLLMAIIGLLCLGPALSGCGSREADLEVPAIGDMTPEQKEAYETVKKYMPELSYDPEREKARREQAKE